jgi:hypothetical protein
VIEEDLMTLTSDQIGEIERLVDRLKKWQNGDMPHVTKDYSRYIQLIRFVEPQANIVLMGLSPGMSKIVRVVHIKLQELLRKASQVDNLKQENADKARVEDSNLLDLAQDFVLMLERIAENKGQDTLTLNEEEHDINDTEQNIIEALGNETLTGEKLAKKASYPYDFKFKSSLSELRKRGILGNKAPGYFLEPKYNFLLKNSDY